MECTAPLPTLLVFGPHSDLPSEEVLQALRQDLVGTPELAILRDAVVDLPQFWDSVVELDPELQQAPSAEYIERLKEWIVHGRQFDDCRDRPPNLFTLPVTLLLQVTQYVRYLSHLGNDSQQRLLDNVQASGIQGFCVGFLTAVVVACSTDSTRLSSFAANGLRLAFCIGAYVDLDQSLPGTSLAASCIAVRWQTGRTDMEAATVKLVESYPQAYISSLNDECCVTVTLNASEMESFRDRARALGLHLKPVPVHGRFHTSRHSAAAAKLMKLCTDSSELGLPAVSALRAPVRSTVDAEMIAGDSLVHHVIENTLLERADWHTTMKVSIQRVPSSNTVIAVGGVGNHVPPSLAHGALLQVFPLKDLGQLKSTLTPGPSPGCDFADESLDLASYPDHSIAIIGMAGRFPGADSLDEFWDLLAEGKTMVEPAPVDRFKLPQEGEHANTKWWGNFLRDPEAFDHRFFKKSSREAIAWDPQQRILLEVVYEALDSAGYFGPLSEVDTDDYGCYVGAVMNNYYDNLSCHPATAYATLGTSRCFLSGSISHYFGWTGPALTIDTACSSSLVAINTACRAIWSGECSRAVAGGTNVITSPFDYQNLHAAGFLSPTGQCKPFDASADGYCRGEGAGVVVLKRLSDAVKDHDNILGVIVGCAANQNINSSHVTVPHSGSQAGLYRKVMQLANVDPQAVSYVEAHGTGTGVGDPVEVRSIKDAFGGKSRDSILHFGSLKGNIGHTEATAGVAGLIKVLLMMEHEKVPLQASHWTLNPKLPSFEYDRMAIPRETIDWTAQDRLACVNSYGAAGSNSAVIVRQKPQRNFRSSFMPLSEYPLFISASSSTSLSQYCKKLRYWLASKKQRSTQFMASVAFNLADRANHSLPHYISAPVSNFEKLSSTLELASDGSGLNTKAENRKAVVLVFGGQESDFIGLSRDVYDSSKIFRHHLDVCDKIAGDFGICSLYPFVFSVAPTKDIVSLHSALFAVQYASARAWIDCGLKVDAVVGHSFGQLTALCISGTLSVQDALRLIVGRASIMEKYWGPEPGSMICLQAGIQHVNEILESYRSQHNGYEVEIACYNGPKNHVIVGSSEAIDALEHHISDTSDFRHMVRTKRLHVTHGFHSMFTQPLLSHLDVLAAELTWQRPSIYLETCDSNSNDTELDFRHVSHHARSPVFFKQAVERLRERFPSSTWIEAGRGSSVIQLVKDAVPEHQENTFVSAKLASSQAQSSLMNATTELWKEGCSLQYWPFHKCQKSEYEHLSLPPYQFEKTRLWLPFLGREPQNNGGKGSNSISPSELLSFVSFKDADKREAIFKIDPESERFQTMLGGHVMSGQPLAPASFYFELASRAALSLQGQAGTAYIPCVTDLSMNSPIGRDALQDIRLTLRRVIGTEHSWMFSISTRQLDVNHCNSAGDFTEPCTGKVSLNPRSNVQVSREFRRFASLAGVQRCEVMLNHPDAEKMQGKHIYRAFNTVVRYGEAFRGIRQVACVGNEIAGKVTITPDLNSSLDQRLCDTPMLDSFMQFAGLLVNYFNNPSLEDVLVCNFIERIQLGGNFDPNAGDWVVYSNMTTDQELGLEASSDAYVFDATTKEMVLGVFGLRFSKMPQALLARMLKRVNMPQDTSTRLADFRSPEHAQFPAMSTTKESKRHELFELLSGITDIPFEELNEDSSLDQIGVDSLMATEILNDIRSVLAVEIDLSTFLFLENIGSIADLVDEKLGLRVGSESTSQTPKTPDSSHTGVSVTSPVPTEDSSAAEDRPSMIHSNSAFRDIRLGYDQLAKDNGAKDFWEEAYPHQARLVLSTVVEAFAELGCDMSGLNQGEVVPVIQALERHGRLVRQLYRILSDGGLVLASPQGFIRTSKAVENTPSKTVYEQIAELHPQHKHVLELVKRVGSQLAACLTGRQDGLQVVFGDKKTRQNLEELYEFWPLLRTPTILLGDFLLKAFTNTTGHGKFRILEVGAGTGGTTRFIVSHLTKHGIPFEYVFTDISPSLVAAARKQFQDVPNMSFELLDIEKSPEESYRGAFHCIIATNCVHATKNLDVTLHNLREMLRDDGALTLIEITRNMFWLDIVVGLLEGWWLFEDGRSHALIGEQEWNRRLRQAGFNDVLWTDGDTPESKTVRVIGAFPKSKTTDVSLETFVYRKIGTQEIHADVYYPTQEITHGKRLPIALMIHGGSHMLFSRKDVRPAQTRLLLEKGFLPVSLDHRLCPEVSLSEGPMEDICHALEWARTKLPHLKLQSRSVCADGERVVVVGWSSGGQLAMSLGWTAPKLGIRPPEAILGFYCPTNYEDAWWSQSIQPEGAEDKGDSYDILEGVKKHAVTNYDLVNAWEPLSDPRILTDTRCRIVLHINWKAQTIPVIVGGHLGKIKRGSEGYRHMDPHNLPQPSLHEIQAVSPLAQIRQGKYHTPTFLIHGKKDELIPYQQSESTYQAMVEGGIRAGIALVEGAPHICDLSSHPESAGWKAALQGYQFLCDQIFEK